MAMSDMERRYEDSLNDFVNWRDPALRKSQMTSLMLRLMRQDQNRCVERMCFGISTTMTANARIS